MKLLLVTLILSLSGMASEFLVSDGNQNPDQAGLVCNTAAECKGTGYPVCIGSCVGCDALGDKATCSDKSTGADKACYWWNPTHTCESKNSFEN